ncbi:MAG: chitinase [Sphingobacteriales bacterium UTBCD1]|jgi:chitinase|nr:MAG: chitinase [Sphingobacteriales bacterium UTBCD1]
MRSQKPFQPFILLLILSLVFSISSRSQTQTRPVIIGYVGGFNANVINTDQIAAKQLSHINYAFVDIRNNLAWLHNEKTDTVNFRKLNELKSINPDLKILISIGGWTWSKHFSDAVLTGSSRKAFAKSAVDIVAHYDLDGVDIDWEYPGMIGDSNTYRQSDKTHYTKMFKQLRKHLDRLGKKTGKKYFVTTAIGGSREFIQHTQMKKVARFTDYINLMAYDYDETYDSIATHHTNLFAKASKSFLYSADISIRNLLNAGVPAARIVMGAGFYGKGKVVASDENHGLYQKSVRPMFGGGYTYLKDSLVNRKGYVRYWDEESSAPYLFNAEKKIFITYDDEESIKAKCQYILQHKLGGIMFWEYFSDRKLYLLNTIDKEFGY